MLKFKFPKIGIICIALLTVLGAAAFSPEEKPMKDNRVASLQAFDIILEVIKSPRCINCHPTDDVPRQGDDQHKHLFGVTRGKDDHGGPVQKCNTCHQSKNVEYSNVPGAPKWALAPRSMGWIGLTDAQLGQALMDKSKNGGKSPAELVEHMGHDSLVLWAWNPGKGRTPPPVPVEEFRKVLQTWLETGAHVPTE